GEGVLRHTPPSPADLESRPPAVGRKEESGRQSVEGAVSEPTRCGRNYVLHAYKNPPSCSPQIRSPSHRGTFAWRFEATPFHQDSRTPTRRPREGPVESEAPRRRDREKNRRHLNCRRLK